MTALPEHTATPTAADYAVASGPVNPLLTKAIHVLQYVATAVVHWLLALAEQLGSPRSFSLVENTPFIDPRQFDWNERVQSEWTTVRAELDAVLADPKNVPKHQDVVWVSEPLTNDDKWLSFFFYMYGQRFHNQCGRCPNTDRLLRSIPGMTTAFFSILAPGKRIPPHRGPWRGVMRYHLPLIVPRNGECGIRVGDQTASWEEGVAMMFDDSYDHEVWNDTDETRVVLFLDIIRPMRFPYNYISPAIVKAIGWSPIVRRMLKQQVAIDRANGFGRQR